MTAPAPGTLHLIHAPPNPHGAADADLYLLTGNATAGPITQIVPGADVTLPASRLPLDHPFRLKLLHFNDLHGHLACFTHDDILPVFSRMAGLMRARRRQYAGDAHAAVLIAAGGDEFGGAIFDELLGACPNSYLLHAGYKLYTEAGVDVGVLGNHDFDRGPTLLAHALRTDAGFPLLAANVHAGADFAANCHPAALFVLNGVRVGFIGLVTPAQLHPELAGQVHIADPVKTARDLLPALRPLCDVCIILSHLGHSLHETSAGVASAGDAELARSLPLGEVNLIVGAHTHNALNEKGLSPENIVNNIPIVQAGKLGQFVGEVDITIHEAAAVTHARLTATADLPADAAFEEAHVRPLLELARPAWNRVLGRVADDDSLCTDAVRNDFAAGESALANFIADALVEQSRAHGYPADLAVIDASNVRCGLNPGGMVTFGDWFNLMPFADTLCLFHLSGRQIMALLHDNALRVDRPASPHTERGFLHTSRQLRYTISLGPSRNLAQAHDISIDGRPIADCLEHRFLVASGSFLRGSAAAWESYVRHRYDLSLFDLRQLSQQPTHLFLRDLLVAQITAYGGVLPAGGARRDGRVKIE